MNVGKNRLICTMAAVLAVSLGLTSAVIAETSAALRQVREQTNSRVENERRQAESQAAKSIDQEAVAAIKETKQAIRALADGNGQAALAAIERAAGKIDVLVARNTVAALLPVGIEAQVIDFAPADLRAIKEIASEAKDAVYNKDYPLARILLRRLTSEIRIRTEHLPLASYPTALKEAARLVEQQKPQLASTVLVTALNTLVVIDRVSPLPMVVAQEAVNEAQRSGDKDRDKSLQLLAEAKNELKRARELGYAGNDPEYSTLDDSIASLERQLKGKESTVSAFARLKEKLASFFTRQSESEKRSESGRSSQTASRR